jgi:hypothetical protein
MIDNFPHDPPKNYYYEYEIFDKKNISIWLVYAKKFTYNGGKLTKTIWGFYNKIKDEYYSPINSKKIGKKIKIEETNPYSSMIVKQNMLEKLLFSTNS